jgi:hypothetical protein
VGVSKQQPDLAIVIFVGILDDLQSMSMSDHMEMIIPPLLLMALKECME